MKTDIKILLLGLSALGILILYSFSPIQIGEEDTEIRKADFLALATPTKIPVAHKSTPVKKDTANSAAIAKKAVAKPEGPDTTSQKILFIGDSMVGFLGKPFESYALCNGHEIESVTWASSTTRHWAETDTLQHFLRKYDPTYVVICLGSNEIFTKNTDQRREWVKTIEKKLGGLPYVWISPPNWKEVYTFTDMLCDAVGKDRYFDSTHLKLDRGPDHAHPTHPAAAIWMDTVASWMQSDKNRHPIVMARPDKKAKTYHIHALKPYRLPSKKKS
ncbi:MAG: SGNH/GDSL hydrolase family protein [Muribaculaceae bacterium]|nr:SGNH/GDSL hydrolase family protein [Muribaculaceae bacterium]